MTTVLRAASGTPAGTVVTAPFGPAALRAVVPRAVVRDVLRLEVRDVVLDARAAGALVAVDRPAVDERLDVDRLAVG